LSCQFFYTTQGLEILILPAGARMLLAKVIDRQAKNESEPISGLLFKTIATLLRLAVSLSPK
jgi:hypothetical protein